MKHKYVIGSSLVVVFCATILWWSFKEKDQGDLSENLNPQQKLEQAQELADVENDDSSSEEIVWAKEIEDAEVDKFYQDQVAKLADMPEDYNSEFLADHGIETDDLDSFDYISASSDPFYGEEDFTDEETVTQITDAYLAELAVEDSTEVLDWN
jgi:hypothetical protein